MRTFQQISALRSYVRAAREDGKIIGFVPTMGAFHEGHLSLMRKARGECDSVVVSVFVNPTQFGPAEDIDRYPRDIAHDSRLAQAAGVDALFAPSVDEIYPPGSQTVVEVMEIASRWEGEARPGHFRGVATVCAKLFGIVQPDRAYFGRKDYQQLKLIERMAADLCLPIRIVSIPTVREPDGLALSSRNIYLDPESRAAAPALYRAAVEVEALYSAGERNAATLQERLHASLNSEPRVHVQYAVVVDGDTLEPLDTLTGTAVVLMAARVGSARLIDSYPLGLPAARNSITSLRS